MKSFLRTTLLSLANLLALPAWAQTVTIPPRTITGQQETPGVDSTFQGNIVPNTKGSGFTVAIPTAPAPAPSPAPPPPAVTCIAGVTNATVTQAANCPAGYLTTAGLATFTQSATRTTTTSCPSGPYGAPSVGTTTGAWSPTPAAACPVAQINYLPINGQNYTNYVDVPENNAGGHPSGQGVLYFEAWNAGWEIYKQGYGEATPIVLASGGLPSGAVSVQFTTSAITQTGDKPATAFNGASSRTNLIATAVIVDLASASIQGTSAMDSFGAMTITVNYYNAAGALVATATFTFKVGASGSA